MSGLFPNSRNDPDWVGIIPENGISMAKDLFGIMPKILQTIFYKKNWSKWVFFACIRALGYLKMCLFHALSNFDNFF